MFYNGLPVYQQHISSIVSVGIRDVNHLAKDVRTRLLHLFSNTSALQNMNTVCIYNIVQSSGKWISGVSDVRWQNGSVMELLYCILSFASLLYRLC